MTYHMIHYCISNPGCPSQRGPAEVATGPGERPLQVQTKAARGGFPNIVILDSCIKHIEATIVKYLQW